CVVFPHCPSSAFASCALQAAPGMVVPRCFAVSSRRYAGVFWLRVSLASFSDPPSCPISCRARRCPARLCAPDFVPAFVAGDCACCSLHRRRRSRFHFVHPFFWPCPTRTLRRPKRLRPVPPRSQVLALGRASLISKSDPRRADWQLRCDLLNL